MTDRPTCKTCPFYWGLETYSNDEMDGSCHRYPPVLDIAPGVSESLYEEGWIFPVLDSGNWCGEHPRMAAYIASLEAEQAGPTQ